MLPTWLCITLSGALKPALSSISLLASKLTYSLFALLLSATILFSAFVAFRLILSDIVCIIYCCTCGVFKALLAVTLPDSPFAYQASSLACLMLHPFATNVSTSFFCFSVIFTSVMSSTLHHFFTSCQYVNCSFTQYCSFVTKQSAFSVVGLQTYAHW